MAAEPTRPRSHRIVDNGLTMLIAVILGILGGGKLGLAAVGMFDETPGLDGAIHLLIGGAAVRFLAS